MKKFDLAILLQNAFEAAAVAWVARTLVVDPINVYDANIFYPHRGTLAYSSRPTREPKRASVTGALGKDGESRRNTVSGGDRLSSVA